MNVSVVITHFNRIDLLRRAIDSVLRQTFAPCEIIVVDDCSTQVLAGDLESVALMSGQVRLLSTDSNSGAQVARNLGIDAAVGEFIAFLDCDDEWDSRKLEVQIAELVSTGSDVCSCRSEVKFIGRAGSRSYWRPVFRGDPVEFIANSGGHMQTSTLVVAVELARRCRFDIAVKKFQDWDFVFRLFWAGGKFCYVDRPLSIYHFGHGGQMTTTPRPTLALEFFDHHRKVLGEKVYLRALSTIVARMHSEVGEIRAAVAMIVFACKGLRKFPFWDACRVFRKYAIYLFRSFRGSLN